MRPLSCYGVRSVAARGKAVLTEAERLVVEDHRASCTRCRADATFDDGLRALADASPAEPLRHGGIERVIAAAFDSATAPTRTVQLRRWVLPLAAAAVASVIAVVVVGISADADEPLLSVEAAPTAPESTGHTLAAGELIALANATVIATEGAAIRWQEHGRRVELDRGALSVSVAPGSAETFSVITPEFEVVVIGTVFAVDLGGVEVHRGAVRILSPSGEVLAARLQAGGEWRLPAASDVENEAMDESLEDELGDLEDLEDLSPPDQPDAAKSAAEWLELAARQIRTRRIGAAKRSIRRALASAPRARDRAEAKTLLAELALAAGNVDRAVELYRVVADSYRHTRQAESALFAAARLEAKRGRRARARSLLERYQLRYPRGRFASEVERKLEAIGGAR